MLTNASCVMNQVTVLRVFDRIMNDASFLRSPSGREVNVGASPAASTLLPVHNRTPVTASCRATAAAYCSLTGSISQVIMQLQVGTFFKKVLRNMFARLMPPSADADADTPAAAEAAGATPPSHPRKCFTTADCLQAPALSFHSVSQPFMSSRPATFLCTVLYKTRNTNEHQVRSWCLAQWRMMRKWWSGRVAMMSGKLEAATVVSQLLRRGVRQRSGRPR
jgi:hypothetical protein